MKEGSKEGRKDDWKERRNHGGKESRAEPRRKVNDLL
jgi:hypothetical protein